MKISLRLFGALSDYARAPLEFELDSDPRVADLRVALEQYLSRSNSDFRPALLRSSAFADEHRVLHESERLAEGAQLAVLPPVNGG